MTDETGSTPAALRAPGLRTVRKFAELAVTPNTRDVLGRLDRSRAELEYRLLVQSAELDQLRQTVADIEASLPAVLNAITSMSGAARLVKRELESVRSEVAEFRQESAKETAEFRQESANETAQLREAIGQGDLNVLGEVRPHVETLSWLMQRVELVRMEMLNELRYGALPGGKSVIEPNVVNPPALDVSPLRVNIGAGHVPFEGYVNVDMRELPGIDVVAMVDALPFDPGTVDEIYSSHTLEHFPEEVLRRQLLPYWVSLLAPGGTLTTIAPDLEAMAGDYQRGEMPFEDLREVIYGGQEYEGDTHFTGFTTDSFSALLREAGLDEVVIVASNRRNGKCKEFEISARKAT